MFKFGKKKPDTAIRYTSTPKLIFLSLVTFGFYWYVWLWKLITDINKLYPQKYIHRTPWITVLLILEGVSLYMGYKGYQKEYLLNSADYVWNIIHLALALQILKNIEGYIRHEFDIIIKHNIFGWIFFGCFYINYKINSLPGNIKKALNEKIEKIKMQKE